MAGTISVTSREYIDISSSAKARRCEKVIIDWVGDAANGTVPALSIPLKGFCLKVVTNPGATAPTASYDIALGDPDDNTLDALGGALADRATATTEQEYPVITGATVPAFLAGTYSLAVTGNSVNSATGRIILYLLDSV